MKIKVFLLVLSIYSIGNCGGANAQKHRTPQDLIEIATTSSFNAAAEPLNVTQPTVSARIRSLEDWLGQRMFTRGHGGTGYFPIRAVRPHLAERRLFRVPHTKIIPAHVHVVYPSIPMGPDLLDLALKGLRDIAARESED